jgi:hypothetical protein
MPDSRARGLGASIASINYTKEEPAATKIQSDQEADEHIHEVLNMGFTGGTIVKLKKYMIKPDGL